MKTNHLWGFPANIRNRSTYKFKAFTDVISLFRIPTCIKKELLKQKTWPVFFIKYMKRHARENKGNFSIHHNCVATFDKTKKKRMPVCQSVSVIYYIVSSFTFNYFAVAEQWKWTWTMNLLFGSFCFPHWKQIFTKIQQSGFFRQKTTNIWDTQIWSSNSNNSQPGITVNSVSFLYRNQGSEPLTSDPLTHITLQNTFLSIFK